MRWVRILPVIILFVAVGTAIAGPRDSLWTQVDTAISKGLPQTAITLLDQIIPGALRDQANAEATKAICLKINLQGQIAGYDIAGMIVSLQAQIDQAPDAMKPVMEAVLADWYWRYFQQNRYRFLQRTTTAEPSGEDITTWDLARILAEIDKHFVLALAGDTQLKAIPIGQWKDLLDSGTMPDTYRPTLYDFLAQEALTFYKSGEQAALPEESFEIMADSPIFAPAADFLQWNPVTSNTDSAKLKAVHLYQGLLAFHQNDADRTAFIDADLDRLVYGYNVALGPEKETAYEAALARFVADWPKQEVTARALYQWASAVYAQGDYVRARTLAKQGWDGFPTSVGGAMCYNLIQQIEGKSATIQTERVWNDPLPDILVTYKNVTKIYFKAISVRFDDYGGLSWWSLTTVQKNALLAAQPALTWNAMLPPTQDYQQRTEALPAPSGLAKGYYFIIASHDPSFAPANNKVSVASIWVSDLTLVVRTLSQNGSVEGFVLDAKTGEPIAGAAVTRWKYGPPYRPADQTHSDNSGLFRFSYDGTTSDFLIVAEFGGQRVSSGTPYYVHAPYPGPAAQEQAVFFTDRAIYRPGQTIQYKGICIRTDTVLNNYQTLAGVQLIVVFRDVDGQEVARQNLRSNDYGSFSGSFIAPRDRLTGRMSIDVLSGPSGSTYFNVEEYKRPKFYAQLDAPTEAPRLNTDVVVPGKATAYTGASIGGAKVEWRVVRQVRYPLWRWWVAAPQSQAIAHGEGVTDADGSYSITFTAKPDLSVLESDEPVFGFQIHADVTDTTGETRSADRTVWAGYTALQASLDAAGWQTPDMPVELTVTTQTIDGQPEVAAGKVRVYALKQPDKVARAPFSSSSTRTTLTATGEPAPDASNPDTWEVLALVSEQPFATDASGQARLHVPLAAGIYRAELTTQDRFGKAVGARHTILVVDSQAQHFGVKIANEFAAPSWTVEPGQTFVALWGTGYDTGRAYIEIECSGQVLRAWWTNASRTQELITQPVTEDMRGGFTLRATYVRENRAYLSEQIVSVPWTSKRLTIQWQHFRSLLQPGEKDTWTAVITGPDAKKAVAEMVASLYDASLDQFIQPSWIQSFSGFRSESSRLYSRFENGLLSFSTVYSSWTIDQKSAMLTYRHFPSEIMPPAYSWSSGAARGGGGGTTDGATTPTAGQTTSSTGPDLSQIPTRTDFDETAFFFPHLLSGSDGVVKMEFTMPESLTTWRFLGFAHDGQMRSGYLTDATITAKDLMVEANPPRFVREGDTIEFTVKVTNRTAARQTGKVSLTLTDARTLESRDQALGNTSPELDFDVPSQESRTYSWRLTIPDGCEMLTYKAVGATTRLSDGEEAYLPVLSRRILVNESLPLPIRGIQTKDFTFTSLLNSGQSTTLRNESLTVQMVSQPAWYAVMALPYLMEYPYQCSEQIFNRFYANSLASYIANSDPKIRRIFDQWKATPALDSPLEKDADLKTVALEETPWVRQAISESEARRNVGILFDQNRLNSELSAALFQLQQTQLGDGLWPWFAGCAGNDYITLYIVTGFGRLRHLGVQQVDVTCAVKALDTLDKWMDEQYHAASRDAGLDPTVAFYLYGRSFFLTDHPVAAQYQEALNYWLGQSRQYWLSLSRQSQGHLALGLKRFGDKDTPAAIMKSIKEHSTVSDEMGMYWQDAEHSWWWYQAPIETQALMIEAFDEVSGDAQAVEDCRVWLLKQKQTQDWTTTKATADAIYGLLLRGADLLSSNALVQVALAGQWIQPTQVEAGTGFYEERFVRNEITADMGHITVKKTDDGVSWGAVHWQYLEDMSKVAPYEGTPLQLTKSLYIKTNTAQGQVLYPVGDSLAVGDELVVRIVLRVDRDMEYVHMKDQRGSGTEPVDVLSGYRYQDGLSYYQSTLDTATHFFMDYLRKGTYVFEYSTRIQLKGKYQTGIANIECMYAPEFNSHSASFELEVK
jgi:uncharacterized protein YfaS (alpha-2-macroglobulin family)